MAVLIMLGRSKHQCAGHRSRAFRDHDDRCVTPGGMAALYGIAHCGNVERLFGYEGDRRATGAHVAM
jgi:hypothetical protein